MIAKLFHFLVYAFVALFAFTQYTAYRIRKIFPPEGKFVDVGADRLHYVEYGEGPPIVFVHGLCGQLRNFAYLDLQRLAKSHRVILVDRPGSGRSTRGPRSSANVYAQARTIAMFIATLGLDKPVVVGHSLGGAISLALALNHPQSVSRIALIAPLTHTETEPPGPFRGLALRSSLVRRFVSLTLGLPVAMLQNRKAVELVFAPEAVPHDFGVKGGGLLGLQPHAFYSASSDLVAAPEDLPDMESRYASLSVPVDVLYGRGDEILNWQRHGEALKKRLDAVNLTVVDGGHMLPVTQPTQTTDWLLDVAGKPAAAEPEHTAESVES
ncbi:alpha/beta fold hydrolase [Burkholderia pseudomallei]|uniref:alpha/beta fold hydrolase n=1 Tax=Burkholderia pseudomallei TaxID=28450 RepID=UPI00052AF8C6|nr:alpha/beta fold hydrolase [Burkholderia pseudomallei]AIV86447.1 esterase family protein [Burkholderia pseudomallei B03]AIV92831.1 esterase family protein [Burkholderia pseudomallei A79A]KGY02428.1 alpha/beta hydrolase family protein [Burkholderia pseudomallei A79D]KGY03545.1 alpha/beta hydrolase family protein [Burkholderia pseudomallei A79C]